jgi:hypothetical protein
MRMTATSTSTTAGSTSWARVADRGSCPSEPTTLERLERAERELRIAGYRIETRVIGVPLRYQVEDSRRFRAAHEALEAAQAAFDAAQDIDSPEAQL